MNMVTSEINKNFFSYVSTSGKKRITRKSGVTLIRLEKNKKESGYVVKIVHNRDTISDNEFFDCYESAEEFFSDVLYQINENGDFFEYENSKDLPCAVRASEVASIEVDESNFSNEYVLILKLRKGVQNQIDFFDYLEETDQVIQDLLQFGLDNGLMD